MSSRQIVRIEEIRRMLTQVAPEATIVPHGDHYYCVKYKGKTFPNLPKGEHGKGPRAEIKVGKVKSMVRLLGIDETKAYEFLGLVVKEKPSAKTLPPENPAGSSEEQEI